jgi:hypothetical protein
LAKLLVPASISVMSSSLKPRRYASSRSKVVVCSEITATALSACPPRFPSKVSWFSTM